MGLSENHGKVYEIHEGTDLEKRCDKNMTGLQSFNGQEPRIENEECEDIISEDGKDALITGLFRKPLEQNLTGSDEDFVDILVDLGKKNSQILIFMKE